MSLPDYLLDPPDEDYCEEHDLWHKGTCPACRLDALDERAEYELERRALWNG